MYSDFSERGHPEIAGIPRVFRLSDFSDFLATIQLDCVRGWATEFKEEGVAVNALWPRTTISTAATKMLGDKIFEQSRKPEIMADAAHWILTQKSRECSGNFFIDEALLREAGVTDFDVYANDLTKPLFLDLLIDEPDGNYFKS